MCSTRFKWILGRFIMSHSPKYLTYTRDTAQEGSLIFFAILHEMCIFCVFWKLELEAFLAMA
jgi:hypothetical protein